MHKISVLIRYCVQAIANIKKTASFQGGAAAKIIINLLLNFLNYKSLITNNTNAYNKSKSSNLKIFNSYFSNKN